MTFREYTTFPGYCSGRVPAAVPATADPLAAAVPLKHSSEAKPTLQGVKGVLFDIDGTLTNSDPLHFKAFQLLLQEAGFQGGKPIDEEFFKSRISGRHNPLIAADLFPDWPEAERLAVLDRKEALFRELAGSVLVPMPGLQPFLRWLDARGLRKAAVTNAPAANTTLMLHALGLGTYFEAVVLGEDCARAKPFPDPYLKGLEKVGLAASEAIVIEDSPAGVSAAVAAGIRVVGITSSQSEETLRAVGASIIIKDYNELLQLAEETSSS